MRTRVVCICLLVVLVLNGCKNSDKGIMPVADESKSESALVETEAGYTEETTATNPVDTTESTEYTEATIGETNQNETGDIIEIPIETEAPTPGNAVDGTSTVGEISL